MVEDINNEIQGKKEYWRHQDLALARIRSKAIFSRPKQRGAQYSTSELVSSGESPH